MLLLFFSSCSTQKNTWTSRHYHNLTTRYNVYFNAHEAYKSGMNTLNSVRRENYTSLLPVYTVSNHTRAKATANTMNRVVEKCQIAIKQHSIRVKPGKKPTSRSKESYKQFYAQEEFNPFMDEVFLLMANAQFHMADFNSSAATATYIIRHFSTDKEVVDKATILLARSYKELGWMYDAENLFHNLNTPSLSPSLNGLFAAAYADFLITGKQYAEAIPYLELAIKHTRVRLEKQRWTFLLAQLHQELGHKKQAYDLYKRISAMNPPYEMEISARILLSEVFPDENPDTALKKLLRLAGNVKNKDYQDQIFYAIGNLYMTMKDTTNAIVHYQKAMDTSTRSGETRIKIQLTFGDLLYSMKDYIRAQTCYSRVIGLSKEDERYPLVIFRQTTLKVLAPSLRTIQHEDSLLRLSVLPEKELYQLIDSLIDVAKQKAREEQLRKMAENVASNPNNIQQEPVNVEPEVNNNWYFYNPAIVTKGLNDFRSKWGNRAQADDWRRSKKTPVFDTSPGASQQTNQAQALNQAGGNVVLTEEVIPVEMINPFSEGGDNPLNRNYYLKDIPFNPVQKAASEQRIATALLKAGKVYRELMNDDGLALSTFRELERRYPDSKELEEAWYISHLMLKQTKREQEAENVRIKLVKAFPEGTFGKRLTDSLFVEHLAEMYRIQDSLYAETYRHFTLNHEDSVFINTQLVKQHYPLTDLMPRFRFLEALELGRTGKDTAFFDSLTYIVNVYPKHDVTPVAKAMINLWKKGMRPYVSEGYASLLSLLEPGQTTDESNTETLASKLTYTPELSHVLLIAYPTETVNPNRLQFDVALYNFTTFLISDYDIMFAKVGKMDVLLIQGFENAADVLRYQSWIHFQNQSPFEKYPGIRFIAISQQNLKLLEEGLNPERYLEFYHDRYNPEPVNPSEPTNP